jgi:hypothetical protein
MKEKFQVGWKQVPANIRKPIVLFVGGSLIVTAGLFGWLPGPGGIPLFLVGVAILATEFVWAEKFKHYMLDLLKRTGQWLKARPLIMWLIIVTCISFMFVGGLELYRAVNE